MPNPESGSHGQYLLLLAVPGVSGHELDLNAESIHKAFMAEFGSIGAFTVSLLLMGKLLEDGSTIGPEAEWTHLIRYFGPSASVGWLKDRIMSVAGDAGAQAAMQTFKVSDITGRY